jgi:SAM-dependent methyltransferase
VGLHFFCCTPIAKLFDLARVAEAIPKASSRMTTTQVNYWPDSACARAFWGQQELPPYRRLLEDTADWLEPKPAERWLDLGCGSGQLTRALWTKSGGHLAGITAIDCALENEIAIKRLRRELVPPDLDGRIQFHCADISSGLTEWPDRSIDGIVSGLAIQYAESYSQSDGRWTTEAYDRLLQEVCRVLRPGGSFVFSVNVPEPAWAALALRSLTGIFSARKPARYLGKSIRMMRYGSWLKKEARRGRFHYLPIRTIREKLARAGLSDVEHRTTFAGQAYLCRCRRPG